MKNRALGLKYYAEKECVANGNLGNMLREAFGNPICNGKAKRTATTE